MVINNIPNFRKSALSNDFEAFNQIINDYISNNVFTINIVKISSLGENTVNVLPVIKQQTTSGKIIEITAKDIIYNVPVLFFQGGDCSISFKLNLGDYGFLITTKEDCNNFIKTLEASTAGSYKTFNISSSFFIPFQIMNINSNILIKNSNSTIEVTPTEININGTVNITGDTTITANQLTTGIITAGQLIAQNGASGSLVDTPTGHSITFVNGIITAVN